MESRRKSMKSKCPKCKDTFDKEKGMKVHHSHGESLADNKTECEICGCEFETYEPERRKTCSKECSRKYTSQRQKGDRHWNWQGGKSELECKVCGDKFKVKQGEVEKRKTCSNECSGQLMSQITGKEKWSYKEGKTSVTCKQCGYKFKTYEPERRKTCSRECLFKLHSGKKHPRWVEGFKPEYGNSWKEVSEEIREKYNRRCFLCSKKEKKLERKLDVHHILPVSEFDEVNQAHFEENLVALCRSCHLDVEWNKEYEEQSNLFNKKPNEVVL